MDGHNVFVSQFFLLSFFFILFLSIISHSLGKNQITFNLNEIAFKKTERSIHFKAHQTCFYVICSCFRAQMFTICLIKVILLFFVYVSSFFLKIFIAMIIVKIRSKRMWIPDRGQQLNRFVWWKSTNVQYSTRV